MAAPIITAVTAIAGIVVGWCLNLLRELVVRKWQRAEKARELFMERGEELLNKCQETLEWLEKARKTAFAGDIYIPVHSALFRVAAIVDLYYPSLGTHLGEIDAAVMRYRVILVDIAAAKMRAGQGVETPNVGSTLAQHNEIMQQLIRSITSLNTAARIAVRQHTHR